jgi:flagellar FliL protein
MTGKKQPFMVTTMVLEVGSPEEQKIVEEVRPRIENEIVTYLRSLRPEDVQGAAGLQRLREELLMRVKEAAKPAKVKDILFKEMLVQQ